jgi:hypothetical protein
MTAETRTSSVPTRARMCDTSDDRATARSPRDAVAPQANAGVTAGTSGPRPRWVRTDPCQHFDGLAMLYVGITPKPSYKDGRQSKSTFTSASATTTRATPKARLSA